jgi:hypothetical protein
MSAVKRSLRSGICLLALAAGCTWALPRQPMPVPDQGKWPAERDRFTRSLKIYDRLDDKAFATVTYQAPSVRAARVERVAVWRGLTDQERDARLAQERDEAAQFEDFLLAFYTNDRGANDLDSPKSVWRVALELPGVGEVLPTRIEVVHVDAALQQLYPYIGNFDTVYRLRFPRWPGPKALAELPFVLRIAGALGNVELLFDHRLFQPAK